MIDRSKYNASLFAVGFAALTLGGCQGGSPGALSTPFGRQAADARRAVSHSYVPACPCAYVANQVGSSGTAGEITIYPSAATGNYSPGANTITGSVTNLDDPAGIAVDSTNKIFVANEGGASGIGSVTTYAPGSAGNVAPLQTIAGPATGLMSSSGVAVNPGNGDIFVTNRSGSVTVFAPTANGNATPIRTISGTNTQLSGPFGIAVGNSKIFVANSTSSAVTVYPLSANGNVAPSQVISGPATGISGGAFGVAWRQNGKIYVTSGANNVTIFPNGANGNVAPLKSISGSATQLNRPVGISVAAVGRIWVTNISSPYSVTAYRRFAVLAPGNNNIPPIRNITGGNTQLNVPLGIAIR